MLSIKQCDEILNKDCTPRKYKQTEVEEIREMLGFFSELLTNLTIEHYGN